MKPFMLRVLHVAGLLLSLVQADTQLIAKAFYDVKASCTGKVAPAVKATAVPTTATCYKSVACDVVDKMYTATYCPTTDGTGGSWTAGDFYRYFLKDIFENAEIAIVETYQAGHACTLANLTAITVYIADKQCHKTGATSSYIAVSALYGSAVKKFSATSDCTGASTTVSQTYAELETDSCAGTKLLGTGGTTVYLSTVALYDTKDGDCQPAAVPTQVVAQVVEASCTSAFLNNCSGAGVPYTSTVCSTSMELDQLFASYFGYGATDEHPVVMLWEYAAGMSCAATDLSGFTAYLADKKCHKTGTSASFRATRSIDGAVTIKTYATADCTGNEATNLDWDAAKAAGNACAHGANGVADTLVSGMGATPLYLKLTATFGENTDACMSPGVPILLESTTVEVDACKASDSCTAADSLFTGTACSSTLNIQDDAAAIFGKMPFVIVEAFNAGKSCAPAELDTITIYLADGRCHKTGDTASYLATRTGAGAATVTTYTDAVCTTGKKFALATSENQAQINSCLDALDGIFDKLVYGGGFTPLYLQSTATFESDDNSCVSPIYLDTTVVGTNACTTSEDCEPAGDLFTGTLCSSTATFKDDAGAAFDSTPFVVVETFTAGAYCAITSLTSSKTYAADFKCHATGAGASFLATRSESGDMTVVLFSDAACQDAIGDPLTVGADGAGLCSNNQIVYGVGESPTVLSTVLSFNNAGCTKPVQLIATNEFSCTASTDCTDTSGHYLQHSCSADHFHTAATMFGDAPYVVVELYKEDDCTTLDGVQVYSSDKACHVAIDGTSFTSTLAETGDGDLVHYSDDKCEATGDGKTTTALTVKMLGAKPPCTKQVKYYAFNGPANPSKTPSTPTTTTATPSSTTAAPTTTSTGSGTSDASSLVTTSSTLTASLGLLATAFGLVV